MKVTVNEDPNIQETEVVIRCAPGDPAVAKILAVLESVETRLACRRDGETYRLDVRDILYIESVERKTFVYTQKYVYETDRRLYELEDILRNQSFFRAAKAVIINLRRVRSLRPEFGSRLLLTMDNDEKILVSRQYARRIREALEVE